MYYLSYYCTIMQVSGGGLPPALEVRQLGHIQPHPATCGLPGSHTQHHTAPTTCTESELESLGPMGILLTSFIADLCTEEG